MEFFKGFGKRSEEKTADYFINAKVGDLIERSVVEGRKRRNIENKISNDCLDTSTAEGFAHLNSISDFIDFPKYKGRGMQELAPDLNGSLEDTGHATLTLWYSDVLSTEVDTFKTLVESNGFVKSGDDYIKRQNGKKMQMSISFSEGKLRIFHEVSLEK